MNKKFLKKYASLFPYFSEDQLEKASLSVRIVRDFESLIESDDPEKQILGLIFMPDPVTGMPNSDISVYLSEKTNPNVRDYIKRFLMSEFKPAPVLTKDNDVALDGVISTRVQSPADWRSVQKELVQVANLSKEEYQTFIAQKKAKDSV